MPLVRLVHRQREQLGLIDMGIEKNHDDPFTLVAADLSDDFAIENLGDETALGTWGSASSWSSASCPASTASTGGSASSFG